MRVHNTALAAGEPTLVKSVGVAETRAGHEAPASAVGENISRPRAEQQGPEIPPSPPIINQPSPTNPILEESAGHSPLNSSNRSNLIRAALESAETPRERASREHIERMLSARTGKKVGRFGSAFRASGLGDRS